MGAPQHTDRPFIAWSYADDWNLSPSVLRRSTAVHLHAAMAGLEPFVGQPAIEGVIVYDKLDSALAVADLMGRQGRSLPRDLEGEPANPLFDEADLCESMNRHRTTAMLHEGSQGMLITLAQDPNRRLLLLPQREAVGFSPLGRSPNEGTGADRLGLLAHELAHAGDYARGRPGRPSEAECFSGCVPRHAKAIQDVSDMALAEYVATRAECAAQVALVGACSADLTRRITPMGRATFAPILAPVGDVPPATGQQAQIDRHHFGYVVGTLAAYADAKAPIADRFGADTGRTTDTAVAEAYPRGSGLVKAVARAIPALHRAALEPTVVNRVHLASALEVALVGQEAHAETQLQKRSNMAR